MGDFTYGVTKVNGVSSFDEALTLSMDFWTVTTYFNILTAADASGNGNAATQSALNKLVEIISLRGQPVILDNPTMTGGVCTLNFAIEHKLSWNTNEGTAPVYGLGAAGAATDGGAAALVAALAAGAVNIFSVNGTATTTAWATATAYTAGQVVTNAAKNYVCVVGGTSAAAPTGSTYGAPITDGTVTWQYAGASTGTAASNLGSMITAAVRSSL